MRMARHWRKQTLWRSCGVLVCNLVDDALDDYDLHVNVAGYVGEEFGDEVVDRGCGEGGAVARCAGGQVGLAAWQVEISDLVVDGEAYQIGVIHHPFPVVALGPCDLIKSMSDPALH